MNRRNALASLGTIAGSMLVPSAAGLCLGNGGTKAPTNIILVVVDDMRFDEFGAGGHPYLKTPHIDRLAAEGVFFRNIFHATPLCSPNRACILTGEFTTKHGVYNNVSRERLSQNLRTVARDLQRSGYYTGHVGKWHMGDDPIPRPGYDYWVSFPGQGKIVDPELWEDGKLHEVPGYVTEILTDRALAFLKKRDPVKPFFLCIGHKAVHPDVIQRDDGSLDLQRGIRYIAAPKYSGRYAGATFARSPTARGPIESRPKSQMVEHLLALKNTPEMAKELPGVLDPGTSEESIRLRAEMMLSVDESMGVLLAALEKEGILDSTAIIFTSDNGFFFGEHGLSVERRLPYEESIRMPVLVRYPPLAPPGAKSLELGSSTDIAPTIMDIAGLPIPEHMQGRSLKKALDGRTIAQGRTGVLIEYFSHDLPMPYLMDVDYKAIRTARYKYIDWVQYPDFEELYDLDEDPFETNNLAKRKENRALVVGLKRELLALVGQASGLS